MTPTSQRGWQAGAAPLCHSLQIPALTGDLLSLLFLLSWKSPGAEWLPISSILIMRLMESSFSAKRNDSENTLLLFLFKCSLLAQETGTWSPKPFLLELSTHNNHGHRRNCCFPQERENLSVPVDSCLQSQQSPPEIQCYHWANILIPTIFAWQIKQVYQRAKLL